MAKYNTYIELSKNFESVVDLDSDKRNPNLWQEYIVHEDMKEAIKKICESLRYQNPDARRSFWIHGTYGTGKSYAAIVIKHLFEEDVQTIESFMSRPILLPYRSQFKTIREKGKFLVVWRSGCTSIHSGLQLMMEMEMEIRNRLKTQYGEAAYYGKKSIISTIQEKVDDKDINWQNIFSDPVYDLSDEYASFEEFHDEVMEGSIDACIKASKVFAEKGWPLFSTVESFSNWIKEIVVGNHLEETGIIFIWDEFTQFVRNYGDDNILQELSELCKQKNAPLFLFLIVHVSPELKKTIGNEEYTHILNRYHELEFHITENAAYDLIGNSIHIRPGMEDQWKQVKDKLHQSIAANIPDFTGLQLNDKQDRLRQLFPLHPMTLSLLTIVADHFGASQRTLFRFMKDLSEADQNVGFQHYINTYGPDDWCWLTVDFLWDYFFTRESDFHSESADARQAYQHYMRVKDEIHDETFMHLFKASLLLIAVMSTEKIAQTRSQSANQKISASRGTLYSAFAGQLKEGDINQCLEILEANNWLKLDRLGSSANRKDRLQIPFLGVNSQDNYETRLALTRKKYTRYELFKKQVSPKDVRFSGAVENLMWDNTRSTVKRIVRTACSIEKLSLDTRYEELRSELEKNPYEIGLLAAAISETGKYNEAQQIIKTLAENDESGRIVFCVFKEPLTEEKLEQWYRLVTNRDLAADDGKTGSAKQYDDEASTLLATWAAAAAEGSITAYYKNIHYSCYGMSDLVRKMENEIIFSVFPSAPEKIIPAPNTVYTKAAQVDAALAGITGETKNTQQTAMVNALKVLDVWECKSIKDLTKKEGSPALSAISELAKYFDSLLSQGAKIRLSDLWGRLQEKPFGYYDTTACSFLLGFMLRFYVNREYIWVTSDGNTFLLNDKTMADMISKLCKKKAINDTISSGSETWQQFKPFVNRLFGLKEEKISNEDQARKNIRAQITDFGTPFWVLKYVPAEKYGGSANKEIASKVVESICTFISDQENHDNEMADVITAFIGRGALSKMMGDAAADKELRYSAFREFIFQNKPTVETLCISIGMQPDDLFDSVKQLMQGHIYTWKETDVIEKLDDLECSYQLIDLLNHTLQAKRKSVPALRQDLGNFFANMKVPGVVVEDMDYPWIPALKILHEISAAKWEIQEIEKKKADLVILKQYAKECWGYLCDSKLILKDYLVKMGKKFDESEITEIYTRLVSYPYTTADVHFRNQINKLLEDIAYVQNEKRLENIWEEKSGEKTISDWCQKYQIPIQWVVPMDQVMRYVSLKSVQDGKRIDESEMHNTVNYFEQADCSFLKDDKYIMECFINNIGKKNRQIFQKNQESILKQIRVKFGVDVYKWAYKAGEIRDVVDAFALEKYKKESLEKVKAHVKAMPDDNLRKLVIQLLDKYPDLCRDFTDSE